MSYYFYPYYWGGRDQWASTYDFEDNDPLFRSFMQSGMARVIVTVRPGFEDMVSFYMKTGLIWNGGEVPTIGEDTYLSLAEEMMKPLGEKKGKPWRQRLPTPLTILQAESIGLVVEKALPCICDNETYEDNLGSFCDDGEFGFIKKPAPRSLLLEALRMSPTSQQIYQYKFNKFILFKFLTSIIGLSAFNTGKRPLLFI